MYAIIDIETTGGSPKTEKITEIAIYIHDGEKLIDEFVSLVNPERPIPYYISQLTGITNEMVEDAPKFYEIAKDIVNITKDMVFVAHNVNFDYNFVKEEFKSLGFDYKREQLCTVKLSRKLLPGYPSYSLGKLCPNFGIEINGRHRAAGDAFATVKLFEILLDKNKEQGLAQPGKLAFKGLNAQLKKELIEQVPETSGIYYFYDEKGDIIYIGKSTNIYKRVRTHFSNSKTDRAIEMKGRITDLSYETTGSELAALLLESSEIKKHKPVYNRAQRRTSFHFGLFSFTDKDGYNNLEIKRNNTTENIPITSFSSFKAAKEQLFRWTEEFELCQKLCGLYESAGACFHHAIGECKGACCGAEPSDSYNERVRKLLCQFDYEYNNFFIIEKGRDADELAVIKIHSGKYIGFGYLNNYDAGNTELMHDCIINYEDNRDIQQIIRTHLKTKKKYRVLKF